MADAVDMTGRVVVVTGGGKGIGRGISERFLAAGAEVVICGRKEPESPPPCQTTSKLTSEGTLVGGGSGGNEEVALPKSP